MEQIPPPKEVKILETAEDIQERREQVRIQTTTRWNLLSILLHIKLLML